MSLTSRTILILMLMLLPLAHALSAQPATATATASSETATETDPEATSTATTEGEPNSYETRRHFSYMLQHSPPELATILKLDPTLLSNEPYLASYPQLAKFIADHPEVKRNPRFYLGEFELPSDQPRNRTLEDVLQGIFVLTMMTFFAFVLAWLVRTIIEQKRWNRLSKTQSEVHNKILDRFGSTDELLQYVKSPAGTKFLESAPIPLRSAEPAPQNAPLARLLWSIHIGIIIAAAAFGTLIVSFRFGRGGGQELFAIGIIALCVGFGFIGSGVISMLVSRRLGVWQAPPAEAEDSGLVR